MEREIGKLDYERIKQVIIGHFTSHENYGIKGKADREGRIEIFSFEVDEQLFRIGKKDNLPKGFLVSYRLPDICNERFNVERDIARKFIGSKYYHFAFLQYYKKYKEWRASRLDGIEYSDEERIRKREECENDRKAALDLAGVLCSGFQAILDKQVEEFLFTELKRLTSREVGYKEMQSSLRKIHRLDWANADIKRNLDLVKYRFALYVGVKNVFDPEIFLAALNNNRDFLSFNARFFGAQKLRGMPDKDAMKKIALGEWERILPNRKDIHDHGMCQGKWDRHDFQLV